MEKTIGQRIKARRLVLNKTLEDVGKIVGVSKQTIQRYEVGVISNIPSDKIEKIAIALSTTPAYLMGWDNNDDYSYLDNYVPIAKKKIPLLGTIAAGQPILADEHIEEYLPIEDNIHADFALKVKGDSMINANINDGDIVFIRKQETVNDGQIAAVLIDDSATLKRVYHNEGSLQLLAENPTYKPIICTENTCSYCKILGIAVAILSQIV